MLVSGENSTVVLANQWINGNIIIAINDCFLGGMLINSYYTVVIWFSMLHFMIMFKKHVNRVHFGHGERVYKQ